MSPLYVSPFSCSQARQQAESESDESGSAHSNGQASNLDDGENDSQPDLDATMEDLDEIDARGSQGDSDEAEADGGEGEGEEEEDLDEYEDDSEL